MFTVYSKDHCIWCDQAKNFLTNKNIPFEEKKNAFDELKRIKPDAKTFPQIFKGDEHIGGCSELVAYIAKQIL